MSRTGLIVVSAVAAILAALLLTDESDPTSSLRAEATMPGDTVSAPRHAPGAGGEQEEPQHFAPPPSAKESAGARDRRRTRSSVRQVIAALEGIAASSMPVEAGEGSVDADAPPPSAASSAFVESARVALAQQLGADQQPMGTKPRGKD